MKLVYLVYTLLVCTLCNAQIDTLNESYNSVDTTQYSNIDTLFYHDNIIEKLFFYKGDNKLKEVRYHSNGNLSLIMYLDNVGRTHGKFESWYENGQISIESVYIHDTIDGKGHSWNSDGSLNSISDCKMGDCETKYLYPSGKVKKIQKHYLSAIYEIMTFCENGRLTQRVYPGKTNMPYYFYHCDGQMLVKGTVNADGTHIGNFEHYYPNGNYREKGAYANREGLIVPKIGKWTYYNEDGKLVREEIYDDEGTLIKTINLQ